MLVRFFSLSAACLLALPSAANACAVCFGGEDDNRQAFIDTTIILTIAPLFLVGLFLWLMVRRIRKVESREAAEAAQAQNNPGPEAVSPPGAG